MPKKLVDQQMRALLLPTPERNHILSPVRAVFLRTPSRTLRMPLDLYDQYRAQLPLYIIRGLIHPSIPGGEGRRAKVNDSVLVTPGMM